MVIKFRTEKNVLTQHVIINAVLRRTPSPETNMAIPETKPTKVMNKNISVIIPIFIKNSFFFLVCPDNTVNI